MRLLIRNGRVMSPADGTDRKRDILLEGKVIRRVSPRIAPEEAGECQVIDALGLVVAPGLMDAHVHFRDPGFPEKEDILSGSRAAARGGFTRVLCMANTRPAVDNAETLAYCLAKGKETGIHVMQAAAVTKGLQGKKLTDMELLARCGAAAFTDDGIPLLDERLLKEAMERCRDLGKVISLHEEHPMYVRQAGINDGAAARQLGLEGASCAAEDLMVARDCVLALYTGARVCIQHISSAVSVQLVRTAKALGARVIAEATPHHFTLTEEDVLRYGTNARMNPPLRTENDRRALIEGLQDGTIDLIVTDHAPHTAQEKAKPFTDAPSGIIGLETSLALAIRSLVMPGYLSLMDVLRLMSLSPAAIYGCEGGSIREGDNADLVIFGEKENWTAERFASRAANSPFLGWELPGKIHMTVCDGEIVYSSF